jgi:hypothetical protein
MRLLSFFAGALVTLSLACTSTAPPGTPRTATAPTVHYPDTVANVLGVSATPEFLADNVTAAADRQRLAADGFHIIRFDLLWPEVETSPGVWDWTEADRIVDSLLADGFLPLILLAYGHPDYVEHPEQCLAHDTGIFPCLPTDPAPFVRYAGEVAKRYGDRVRLFEVWNEANGWFRFWPQVEGGDPAAYARLVSKTARAVHAACSECTVISGGLVYLPTPITTGQVEFQAAMRAEVADVFQAVDGVGFHAYTFYPPIDAPENQGDLQVPLDQALAEAHASCECDRPLWITETGWTAVAGLSHETRAQYAARGLLIALSQGAQSWLWWSVRDVVREDLVAPQEGHFGLLAPDGAPHPAYTAVVNTMREIGEAVSVTDLRDELGLTKPYAWALRFTFADGAGADVAWYAGRGEGPRVSHYAGRTGTRLTDGTEVIVDRLDGHPVILR